ncbi:MAG: DNA polymerase III subunit chi [Woeseiaceae bacterium]|nr:DNA polymerase III subunit chi [Woeseiaceae bacterium]
MAQVDFYVLDNVDEHSRFILACKLTEKAWRLGNKIHIHTMNQVDAERLDELLWTFRNGSFVPHKLMGNGNPAPVSIGYGMDAMESRDLLINLCDEIPAFMNTFPRIAELVTSKEECLQKSRKRYTIYRDQGHTLEIHKI